MVKSASKAQIMVVVLVFVSILVAFTAGFTAVWLTKEVRMFALVLLPTGTVAALLVLYFDWRDRMRRQILAERDQHEKAA
jgi:hypothetical protein